MRLNTRGRYGIQLMAQLACHSTQPEPLGLKHVAEATGLPWRYLEQIARPLRRAALVKGRAGRSGGYMLAKPPDQITLRDVIEATSGPLCLMDCVDHPDSCGHTATCTSRAVWLAVTADIREVLARYTLCDLASRPCAGCRQDAASARTEREANGHRPRREAKPAGRKAATRARGRSSGA